MKLKVITLKFNEEQGCFDDTHLEESLQGKEVLQFREIYFERGGESYWNILVCYRDLSRAEGQGGSAGGADKKTYQEILEEGDMPLFEELRKWRNGKAKQLGLSAYVIMSNMDIAHVARRRPPTLQSLGELPGIGEKKTEHYGLEILGVIAKFEKKGVDEPRTT